MMHMVWRGGYTNTSNAEHYSYLSRRLFPDGARVGETLLLNLWLRKETKGGTGGWSARRAGGSNRACVRASLLALRKYLSDPEIYSTGERRKK